MTEYSDKADTIKSRSAGKVETAKLDANDVPEIFDRDPSQIPPHASFWCISLTVVEQGVQMVINISGKVLLGRLGSSDEEYTFVDLTGYNAHECGVSRRHAIIALLDDKVIIKDNNSANRTLLNNKKLRPLQEYPLKPGDEISLGKLRLTFNLVFDPFG